MTVVTIPELSAQLLGELADEMGGYDFSDVFQKEFLSRTTSCDVQAAPGNGKTTLLVAKLALLARTWESRSQGVCVISHTNAAREEVAAKLAKNRAGSMFLSYPHFIGTVTAFIDQFIALPYMRGLGWRVKRIDDDVFRDVALRRYGRKQPLRARAQMRQGQFKHQVEMWVSQLSLAEDFVASEQSGGCRIKVRVLPGQHGAHTDCGRALEELKAELIEDGYFRFEDLTAAAVRALADCPNLADRLRHRFPLVLLDEAQDTTGLQVELLERLFGNDAVAYQRLGDLNQSLYENNGDVHSRGWTPRADAIPLDQTRRFGDGIAEFASRLTPRRNQTIKGKADESCNLSIIRFDEQTIGQVIPTYAAILRAEWPGAVPEDVWAIASRHSLASPRGRNWPKTLIDYHPAYRPAGERVKSGRLCSTMRKAASLMRVDGATQEVAKLIAAGTAEMLMHLRQGVAQAERPTVSNVWRQLEDEAVGRGTEARRFLRDNVLRGDATTDAANWAAFCRDFQEQCGHAGVALDDRAEDFLAFVEDAAPPAGAGSGATTRAICNDIIINLGSIHSLKGRTVSAVLIVETEIFRENRKLMDLEAILPHALGLDDKNLQENEQLLSAATNVFVGATRPRRLLALAVRKAVANSEMQAAALSKGWTIHNL